MESLVNYEESSWIDQHKMILDQNTMEIVKEYCKIASQKSMSDRDANRLYEILDMSQQNNCLEFWINEVDHFMDHELGLETGITLYPVETEKLRLDLKTRLKEWSDMYGTIQELADEAEIHDEINEFLHSGNQEGKRVQEDLKRRGLYDGPIDGMIGSRTQQAIIQFQKKNHLKADGKISPTTLMALGYQP